MFLPRDDDSQSGIIGFTDDSGIEAEVVSVYFEVLNGVWIETIYIYLIDRSYWVGLIFRADVPETNISWTPARKMKPD